MSSPKQTSLEIPEQLLLDVGVAVFDPNIPEDFDERVEQNMNADIRQAEANYMAYTQKNMLQSTGNWGAVRVLPQASHAVDIILSASILHSDGERLNLKAKVVDATGNVWFEKEYLVLASKYAFSESVPRDIDPFHSLYKNIADDMWAYYSKLSLEDIQRIHTTAEMKFARSFSKEAFSSYVTQNDKGEYLIQRLPAEDDPMLIRIRKVREREYLFIDTLDEYFSEFQLAMYSPYLDWREATYEEAVAIRQLKQQAKNRAIIGTIGVIGGIYGQTQGSNYGTRVGGAVGIIAGATLLKSALNKRAAAKIHSEVLQELGASAEAEMVPHTIELENQTVRLTGSVDKQYSEFRRILRRLYYQELGLPAPEELSQELPEALPDGIQTDVPSDISSKPSATPAKEQKTPKDARQAVTETEA
ncbi:MAG: hypothetical protein KUG75_06730 [Pseudomonadales bacterium]|nr:hypothetical protein [Pseudomonadales bacterium]